MGDRELKFYEPSNQVIYKLIGIVKCFTFLPHSLLQLRHVKITGVAKGKNSHFILHYIGTGENLNYIKNICFSKVINEKRMLCSLFKIKIEIDSIHDHPVFVEVNRLLRSFVPDHGFETDPWIRQKIFFKGDTYQKRKRKIKDLCRKVIKHKFQFKIVSDQVSLTQFYNDFYVPYITYRFGDATHLRSFGEIRNTVKNGFLLKVFDENIWIASVVCEIRKKEIKAFAFGIIPDYNYHLKRGALLATYFFLFKWAQENNMETIDLMRSRPHLDDGVYEHKRRWASKTIKDCWHHTIIKIFIPKDNEMPSFINRLLVWNKNEFVELERLLYRNQKTSNAMIY